MTHQEFDGTRSTARPASRVRRSRGACRILEPVVVLLPLIGAGVAGSPASASEYEVQIVERISGADVGLLETDTGPLDAAGSAQWSGTSFAQAQAAAWSGAGELVASLCMDAVGDPFSPATRSVEGRVEARITVDDIVISGPESNATIAVNVDWLGEVETETSGFLAGIAEVQRELIVRLSGFDGAGSPVVASPVQRFGHGDGAIDERITTSSILVSTAQPVTVELDFEMTGDVDAWGSFFARIDADYSERAAFATGIPVFDLPPGFTANSVDGQIVDNVYLPEPLSRSMLAWGVLALAALRPRAASRRGGIETTQPGGDFGRRGLRGRRLIQRRVLLAAFLALAACLQAPAAWAQGTPTLPFTLLLESDDDRDAGSEVFLANFDSLDDLVNSILSSVGFSDLNVASAFNVAGLAFDGQGYHLLLESIDDRGAGSEVFYIGYDSLGDLEASAPRSLQFTPLDVGNASTLRGFTYDGVRFHLLLESDEDAPAGVEVLILSFDSIANLLDGQGISVAFTDLDIGASFSIGGFVHDGAAFQVFLESNDNAAGGSELVRVQHDTVADVISGTPSAVEFTQVDVGQSFRVGAVTVPEPSPGVALAVSVAAICRWRRRTAILGRPIALR